MSNLAAAFATSVAAIFLAVLGLTSLTALFGSQQIEAPLLYTILITHAATLVVAWITSSVSDVASANAVAQANQQRGVAAFVFTNAAGAVVTLATNGMESWELGVPENRNALTILLEGKFATPATYLFVYLLCIVGIASIALVLTVVGSRMFKRDRPADDVPTHLLSAFSIVMLVIAVSIGVSWKATGGNTAQVMDAWAYVVRGLLVLAFLASIVTQGLLLSVAATLFASTAANGVVRFGRRLVSKNARDRLLRNLGTISLGVSVGLVIGAAAFGFGYVFYAVLQAVEPTNEIVRRMPATSEALLKASWDATIPILLGVGVPCVMFAAWPHISAWWEETPSAAYEVWSVVSRRFDALWLRIRDWWDRRKSISWRITPEWRAAWRWCVSALLWPVELLFGALAFLFAVAFHRGTAEFLLSGALVMLPLSTGRDDIYVPPPEEPAPPTEPAPPPLEMLGSSFVSLCDPRQLDWVLGSVDRFEVALDDCAMPASVEDTNGALVVVAAASSGQELKTEVERATERGMALATWAVVRAPKPVHVYVLDLGMARREDAFSRSSYLFGNVRGPRPVPGVFLSAVPREALVTDADVSSQLGALLPIAELPGRFSKCDLYAFDKAGASAFKLRKIDGFACGR